MQQQQQFIASGSHMSIPAKQAAPMPVPVAAPPPPLPAQTHHHQQQQQHHTQSQMYLPQHVQHPVIHEEKEPTRQPISHHHQQQQHTLPPQASKNAQQQQQQQQQQDDPRSLSRLSSHSDSRKDDKRKANPTAATPRQQPSQAQQQRVPTSTLPSTYGAMTDRTNVNNPKRTVVPKSYHPQVPSTPDHHQQQQPQTTVAPAFHGSTYIVIPSKHNKGKIPVPSSVKHNQPQQQQQQAINLKSTLPHKIVPPQQLAHVPPPQPSVMSVPTYMPDDITPEDMYNHTTTATTTNSTLRDEEKLPEPPMHGRRSKAKQHVKTKSRNSLGDHNNDILSAIVNTTSSNATTTTASNILPIDRKPLPTTRLAALDNRTTNVPSSSSTSSNNMKQQSTTTTGPVVSPHHPAPNRCCCCCCCCWDDC
jgi:hypothetical protein